MLRTARVAALAAGLGLTLAASGGCDLINKVQGLAKGLEELDKHLQKDLESELSDDKIDKVLEVTPELMEFSEEAKVKWTVDPDLNDISKMASALGNMGDYFAFFESHDTRLTEYYVDTIKILDVIAQQEFKKGRKEALDKLEKEKEELEEKLENASGKEEDRLKRKLKQNKIATEKLEETKLETPSQQKSKPPYELSDDEMELVIDREEEIREVFDEAGYLKKAGIEEKKKKKKTNDEDE